MISGSRAIRSLASAMVLALSAAPAGGQTLDDARAARRTGEYRDAIRSFTRLARDGDVAAGRGLVSTLAEVGRYDDAEREARRLYAASSLQFANVLGEVLYARGRLTQAEPLFREAAGGATDSLTARLNLAMMQYDRGELETAMAGFDAFIDVYNSGMELIGEELTAVARAGAFLGVRNYQLFQDALRVYDEAYAVDPDVLTPRVRVGELFFARFNNTEATNTFGEVLEINPDHPEALLGMARSLHFDGKPEAMPMVGKSLEINENSVDARVFLARLHLELENYEEAASEAERALEVDPSSPAALSVIATIRFLQGDEAGYETARRRALQRNPRYAELYNTLAELSARNRLYQEAVDFALQAVAIDSQSWRGYGLLGMNQLRTGAIDEGRANLERYFGRDPYDPWAKNTLDLLDTFTRYRETSSAAGHFQLVMDEDESSLLQLYLADVADEAYERLAEQYGYRPQTPIRLEVYPRHADFSVRTVGLAGLGALGVSFGNVLAMDSPSAREIGAFHWASTLWHEVAHTFHMTVSKHRVPRWFTEGLAVFEERRAHQGWGDDASVQFLMAYQDERMPRVSELNNGFVRPEYPQQVIFSYYMASLVCELIQRDWGDQAIVDMLEAYGAGQSNAEVFRSVLDMEPREFDSVFDRYMRERFTGPLTALQSPHLEDLQQGMELSTLRRAAERREGDFPVQLEAGRALVRGGQYQEALPYLDRAKALFSEYAGGDSPYWYLAMAYKGLGRPELVAAELEALTAINAGHYHAYLEWAGALEELGDSAAAAAVLERAMYVYPFDVDQHLRLATLYADAEQWGGAIRERLAVVALQPVDRAEAEYQVALAYYQSGNLREARRAVLRALELAPNFEKGLDLLLDIRAAGSQPDDCS
jgi:tetratricopeptide (TPR) repeat protein